MNVYIDSTEENLVPELALQAHAVLEDRWNGWVRPLATAEAFGSFLRAWRRNDPNGTWGECIEQGGVLACTRSDDEDDVDEFPMVGVTTSGELLYDLTGWIWVIPDGRE